MKTILDNPDVSIFMAIDAVDSTFMAHPEWDRNERKTFEEWEEG